MDGLDRRTIAVHGIVDPFAIALDRPGNVLIFGLIYFGRTLSWNFFLNKLRPCTDI